MRRRAFISLIGGAVAWPLAARAQQAERVRRIGLLMGSADDREGQARVAALKLGLQELGWTDGRNIQIETRFAGADGDRIRAHVAELVALVPDVIVGQTTPVIRALRQATSSIPIVIAAVNDPVEQGFVSSLAHPGGNITGFTFIDFQMVGKWLEMLKEAAPALSRAGLMFNPDMSFIRLAQQYRVPAVYSFRTYVAEGALMSYGPDGYDNFRRSASYVDRILKGAKPADLPIQQPTKFELAVNLKTAKALGLQIPDKLLALADEVIE